jgi:hypothetical protein
MEVVPLVGVPPLLFGMSGEDVEGLLGRGVTEGPGRLWYFNHRLQIDFPDGPVEFFQISWQPGSPPVMYEGVSVFETPAEELVEHISGQRRDSDYHTFTDLDLDLGLWRPMLPSDYLPTDPDDEYRKGWCWKTIAIGRGGIIEEEPGGP